MKESKTLIGHPVITLITLSIIPAKEGHAFRMKTVIKSRAGKVLGIFEKSEAMTLWVQLLPVFATPFVIQAQLKPIS